MKRQLSRGDSISPPPLKRKVESTTTNKAVANFFKPSSQKEPDKLQWRILENSLITGRYNATDNGRRTLKRRKIAAFDFDSTLIKTSSGNVFGKDPSDWQWWDTSVPKRLKGLYDEGYCVTIISNQGGISLKSDSKGTKSDSKRLSDFKTKVGYVLGQLDFQITIYAATGKDKYRKPRTGMWTELLDEYDLDVEDGLDLQSSFFVGDAGGRLARDKIKADHSSSDRDFAANVGIIYHTPEEYFLGEEVQPFARTFDPVLYMDDASISSTSDPKKVIPVFIKKNSLDVVLFCGSPGAGKSTFYWHVLEPLGYQRVNQDILKTREKCLKVAANHLLDRRSVAVDNTNADPETRSKWVELTKKSNVPIRCVYFTAPAALCKHNDAVRALNETLFTPEKRSMLPGMAFSGFTSRYREPKLSEGFQDIIEVPFRFQGNEDQKKIWKQYWI